MQLISSTKTTSMKITKLLGKLFFTTPAVPSGRIQHRSLQQQQIHIVKESNSCQTKIKLNQSGRVEVVKGEFTSSEW